MYPEFKYYPVNWTDGMKISSREFIAAENAMLDALRDVRCQSLNDYCYGLLPTSNLEVSRYPKLQFNHLQSSIVLLECRAVTPGGHRIEVCEQTFEGQSIPAQLPAVRIMPDNYGIYEVFLTVQPFSRAGAGRYADDVPPRHTNVSPIYELSLQRKGEARFAGMAPNTLKISEVEIRDGRLAVVLTEAEGGYIPACMTVNAHERLRNAHLALAQYIGTSFDHCRALIQAAAPHAAETNQDARDAISLAERIAGYFAGSMSQFNLMAPQQPPVIIFAYYQDLARFLNFHVDLRSAMIKKYYDQFNVRGASEALTAWAFNQADIYAAIDKVFDFAELMEKFFNALRHHQFNVFTVRGGEERMAHPVQPVQTQPTFQPPPQQYPYQQPQPPSPVTDTPPAPAPPTTRKF